MRSKISRSETPGSKDTWPRGEQDTIDWEAVFEHPPEGLVCLLEATKFPVNNSGIVDLCGIFAGLT